MAEMLATTGMEEREVTKVEKIPTVTVTMTEEQAEALMAVLQDGVEWTGADGTPGEAAASLYYALTAVGLRASYRPVKGHGFGTYPKFARKEA